MMIRNMAPPLHIEIVQKMGSPATTEFVKNLVHTYLSNFLSLIPGATLKVFENSDLEEHVSSITICDVDYKTSVLMTKTELIYHVYMLDSLGPETDTITDGTSGEELPSAELWSLPCEEFDGLWSSLIYDTTIKKDTLHFVETAFEFSDRRVDPNLISCNRVVLLHGPPGTGKTSLCKALAQKLSIRLRSRYPRARLLEINSHSLFSKWFSESGKLVFKLFDKILEIVEDKQLLACILIDEVESLTHARKAAMSGLEPSDSLRVVNAILTQLDRIRRHPNVLVLTTSNVTEAIDIAFVDRADIKQYVGPPSAFAAFEILRGCCEELMTRSIVYPHDRLFDMKTLKDSNISECEGGSPSNMLMDIAKDAAESQLSARALRRLPFLARALYPHTKPNLTEFLLSLGTALERYQNDAVAFQAKDIAKNSDKENLPPVVNGK